MPVPPCVKGQIMTSIINQSVVDFLLGTGYDVVSTTVGLAALIALTLLLVEREAVRAYGGGQARRWIHGLDVAVLPLLVAFAIIILLRLLALLPDR
jgi:hypothetical protein